jgi:hypothetical protein
VDGSLNPEEREASEQARAAAVMALSGRHAALLAEALSLLGHSPSQELAAELLQMGAVLNAGTVQAANAAEQASEPGTDFADAPSERVDLTWPRTGTLGCMLAVVVVSGAAYKQSGVRWGAGRGAAGSSVAPTGSLDLCRSEGPPVTGHATANRHDPQNAGVVPSDEWLAGAGEALVARACLRGIPLEGLEAEHHFTLVVLAVSLVWVGSLRGQG